jgi:hypothetical protein
MGLPLATGRQEDEDGFWQSLGTEPPPELTEARHGMATLWPPPEWLGKPDLPAMVIDWPSRWQDEFERRRSEIPDDCGDNYRDDMADFQARMARKSSMPLGRGNPTLWLWLCPGELKTLAVLGCGLPSCSPTFGENRWPRHEARRLEGRNVVLVYDDDAPGRRWKADTLATLAGIAAKSKAITLGRKTVGE